MSERRVHIIQGQFEVSRADPDCCMTTVLGSCISACIFDPLVCVGGMNHFVLATGRTGGTDSASYGVNAMELLINGLLRLGAGRHRLRAHVFGGARMVAGLGNLGERNAAFATGFLRTEGIPVMSNSVGGTEARRVNFWPASGIAREEFIKNAVVENTAPAARSGDFEMF